MFGIGVLADPVSEIKDVGRASTGAAVWGAKGIQHLEHFGLNLSRLGKQHIGIQVTLQRFTAPT